MSARRRRIIVLQHLAVEHPGVFRDLWSAAGHSTTTVELDRAQDIPALDAYDLMVVMGGPMDVWEEDRHPWLIAEKTAIRHWVTTLERPFLGICLGHQLLASSLGGQVGSMPRPEVGVTPVALASAAAEDALLRGFGSTLSTFQWHGAEVSAPPPQAVVLASNAACQVQAMRVGRHAYGFQFHCELTARTVAEWKDIPAYRASLEAALGREGAATLEQTVASHLADFGETSRRLDDNLTRILGDLT